jgi:uncharacterized protein
MDVALVTGASAGLGAGFARKLAAAGHSLLLVARRIDRLETLAHEVATRHQITATPFACDLAQDGAAARVLAFARERGMHVATLINNAGFGLRGEFAALPLAEQANMIRLNVTALTELCHAVLPAMCERRRGRILNIASTASFQPGPWMAVYYATKAYVLAFSEALHEEMKQHGIHVAALCPGPTETEFAAVANMQNSGLFKLLASGADKVERDGLAAMAKNRAVKVSGFLNLLLTQSVRLAPRFLSRRLVGRLQRTRGN